MALQLADRVQENATANTTVSFTLTGAVVGYQSFANAITPGNTTYYGATDGVNWEVGLGTYTTGTLTRTTVYESSNSNAAVSTFSNPLLVFIDYPAEAITSGGGTPGGANTQVQYNNSGAFAGANNFTYTGNSVNIPFGPSASTTASSISRVALAISMMS
jgi:hypothetical protein